MKTLIAVILCAGIAFANGSGPDTGLKGPAEGVQPTVVMPSQLPAPFAKANGFGQETPFGYLISNGHNEDLKNTQTPANITLGGTPNGPGGPLAVNTGTSFNGPGQNGWIPYDAAIAVGPSHVVVLSNSQLGIYTKAGSLVSITQFDSFFGTAAGTAFDPKCFYDASSGHYVLLTDMMQNPKAIMNVAISQTSDPTGAWWKYQLDWTLDGTTPTSNWGDYPSLGYSNDAIFIGANQYSFSSQYRYSKVRVLSKAQLYSGATATWTDFINLLNANGSSAFTVKAGRMLSSSTSEYLLNTLPGGGSYVTLWRIDNAPSSPSLTRVATVSIGTYAVPPNGRQPGGSSIATNDCRTQDMVMQGDMIYTAFNEKYGTKRTNQGAGIRYLKISTSGVKNTDISYFTTGKDWYYPAVTVDGTGNMMMTFGSSSKTEYASIYQTGMKTTETVIEAPGLVKAGSSTITYGRWGDYSGIANDPTNSGAVWEYGGWAASGGAWGTWITSASFGVAPKANPEPVASQIAGFSLEQNAPNPFHVLTTMSYTLPDAMPARLAVYDALGRLVATLDDGLLSAGLHQATFNAAGLPGGIYYAVLETAQGRQTRAMMLTN